MAAEHHIDVHRQPYNHVKWDYENSPEDDKPSEYQQNNKLPEWKRQWPVFEELHSKAAQATVARFHRNLSNLRNRSDVPSGNFVSRDCALLRRTKASVVPIGPVA